MTKIQLNCQQVEHVFSVVPIHNNKINTQASIQVTQSLNGYMHES
jgi:hypothetical protein